MFQSLRGHFLISAKHLRDSNFYKSVVLLLEHNSDGSMGIVINWPMALKVSSALEKHFEIPDSPVCLYCGGPVEESALLILHNSPDYDQEFGGILPNLFVGTSPDVFEKMAASMRDEDSEFRFRIFAGYSGWSGGQLESELNRGDWHTLPASSEYVFRAEPYEIWEDALREFQAKTSILPTPPKPQSSEWN